MDFQARTSAIQQLLLRSLHRKEGRATISENTRRSPIWQQGRERPRWIRVTKQQMTGRKKRNCDPDRKLR